MLSLGTIAQSASSIILALTNRTVTRNTVNPYTVSIGGVVLSRAGNLYYSNQNWNDGEARGQWVASGATPTIGDSFEVRFDLVSGFRNSTASNVAASTWAAITGEIRFYLGTAGSFDISIRAVGTTAVLATSRITVP
jgi:hypothetical protein